MILNAGMEIHFLSIRDLLIADHSFTDILRVGVEIDRANAEIRFEVRAGGRRLDEEAATSERQSGHEYPRSTLAQSGKRQTNRGPSRTAGYCPEDVRMGRQRPGCVHDL